MPTVIAQTNSQNLELLQANVSLFMIQNRDTDLNIISDNALVPLVGPAGVSDGTGGDVSSDISIYTVRKGDTISQIAEMFGVSVDTIRWSNDIKVGQKLAEGEVLVIPPVSGLIHTVTKGQTVNSIAKLYKIDASEITGFNDIPEDGKLEIGDELIVPDGKIIEKANPAKTTPNTKTKSTTKTYAGKDLGGYFTNPVPQYVKKTQGLHGHNGIDLAAPKGTPIVSAADGIVTLARSSGYNGGYGLMIIIKHPNGTETLYGHLSKLNTHTGAQVSKGQVIGYMGSTGRSTGSHLHYEIHGARNSAADLPVFNK